VFLAAVPAMALLLLAGPVLLPEFRSDQAGRLDLASVGLSLAAVLLMVYRDVGQCSGVYAGGEGPRGKALQRLSVP
jgi:hypothetical protein